MNAKRRMLGMLAMIQSSPKEMASAVLDRVEKRAPLTKRQVSILMERQDGLCGAPYCLTFLVLGPKGQRTNFIDEHLTPLKMGGSNALTNRALWCKACAKRKTFGTKATTAGSDLHRLAKIKRIAKGGKTRRGPEMKSRGFSKTLRKRMDGRVEKR